MYLFNRVFIASIFLLNLLFISHQGCGKFVSSVVACTCNPATLEAKFWNGVGLIPVGGNSPSIGGWIV